MILDKILSPIRQLTRSGLRSRNPQTRIRLIKEQLEPGHPELEKIALSDESTEVRNFAISRVNQIDTIIQIIKQLQGHESQKHALLQLAKIISGEIFPIPDLETRISTLKSSLTRITLEYIALHAKEAEIRLSAVKKIHRDAFLGDIALNDPNPQVRIVAATQINSLSTLERVFKQARGKDKRVHKICKQKYQQQLDELLKPQKIQQQIQDICEQLNKVIKRDHILQELPLIQKLEQQWLQIQQDANEQQKLAYKAAVETINQKLRQIEKQKQEEQLVVNNLKQILSSLALEAEALLQAQEQQNKEWIRSRLKAIALYQKSWDEQINQIDNRLKAPLQQQYRHIVSLIESQQHDQPQIHSLRDLYQQGKQLLENNQIIGRKLLDSLIQKFEQTARTLDHSLTEVKDLQRAFSKLQQQLQKKIEQQQLARDREIAEARRLLEQMQQQIEEGATEAAFRIQKKFQQLLENSNILGLTLKEQLNQQLADKSKQLYQLNDWKFWANEHHREALATKAEEILKDIQSAEHDISYYYEHYSDQLKNLRQQWKQLKGKSNEDLWQRFDQACNQCFDAFKPYFEKQQQIREKNRQQKMELVNQLRDYLQHMGWLDNKNGVNTAEIPAEKDIDWSQVERILKQAKAEWYRIGKVEKQYHKPLQQQYQNYIKIIEKHLRQVWDRHIQAYEQIIEQARALENNLDSNLDQAVSAAKELQKKWQQIGHIPYRKRKKLWNKFRQACDVIFDKRDEQNDILNQRYDNYLLEKTGLCENLEALNQQQLELSALNKAYDDILASWNQIVSPNQRNHKDKPLNLRFRQAQKQFRQKIEQLKKQEKHEQLELLQQKAHLCSQIELASATDEEVEVKAIEQQWKELAALSDKTLDKAIQKRFADALQNYSGPSKATTEDIRADENLLKKREICIKYEILTDQQTPEPDQELRLKIQIQLINEKEVFAGDPPYTLIQQWFLIPDHHSHKELNLRFQGLMADSC